MKELPYFDECNFKGTFEQRLGAELGRRFRLWLEGLPYFDECNFKGTFEQLLGAELWRRF